MCEQVTVRVNGSSYTNVIVDLYKCVECFRKCVGRYVGRCMFMVVRETVRPC